MLTLAFDPAAPVVVLATERTFSGPVAPVSPRGIVKLKMPFVDVPVFVTLAKLPAGPVVVVPTLTVPVSPLSPRGIVKLKTAALEVPTLETEAELPAAPVEVEPTAIVAAVPVLPFGKVRFSTCEGLEPVILAAGTPVSPVVTVPISKTLAGPVGPVAPLRDSFNSVPSTTDNLYFDVSLEAITSY